jgi:hypothetical protein
MITTAFCGLLFLLGLPLAYATTVLVLDLILCTAAVLAGMLYARRVRVTHYTLRIKDVPNCKIVFFSDLHLGDFCTTVHLKGIVDKIQKEMPDLVLYGGDLVDMDLPGEKKLDCYAVIGANNNTTGDRERTVEPGVKDHTTVALNRELGISAERTLARCFHAEGGGVAVRGGDNKAVSRGGLSKCDDGRAVTCYEILAAARKLPSVALRKLDVSLGNKALLYGCDGVVSGGGIFYKLKE